MAKIRRLRVRMDGLEDDINRGEPALHDSDTINFLSVRGFVSFPADTIRLYRDLFKPKKAK